MRVSPGSYTLFIGHDPMCSFCWAFRPSWEIIEKEISAQTQPSIQIISLLGGLAPDSDEPMPSEMRSKLSKTWKYIEEKIPGTQFNHDYWLEQAPRRSTYPACRAVLAAKMISPESEDSMTLAIQTAYYLQAKNPSDDDTLIQCAVDIGLNTKTFQRFYQSEECKAGFMQEMALCRQLGINSFPSIVLAKENRRFNIPIQYTSPELMLQDIKQTIKLL